MPLSINEIERRAAESQRRSDEMRSQPRPSLAWGLVYGLLIMLGMAALLVIAFGLIAGIL